MLTILIFAFFWHECTSLAYLPCLTQEAKLGLDDSKKALTELQNYLGQTINTLDGELDTLKNHIRALNDNVKGKVKQLDVTLEAIEDDFRNRQWLKYNGHCYYYSNESNDWFTAQRRCREIGGYIVKIDDSPENTWVLENRPTKSKTYWIGLTDLTEGTYRWDFDQSVAKYLDFHSAFGSRGTSYNCVLYNNIGSVNRQWLDYTCDTISSYICERNVCV